MITYNYCPKCSTKLKHDKEVAECSKCGIKYYQNSSPTASVFIIQDNKVLLSRRGIEPYKGKIDIIGGFLKYGEHPKDGAIRECREETGLDIQITQLLGIYIDTYGDNGEATLNIQYIGKIISGVPKPADDVSALEWFALDNLPQDAAFKNSREALLDLKKWYDAK